MKHLVGYQREVHKGKLTAVVRLKSWRFEHEPFLEEKCLASSASGIWSVTYSDEGLTLETSAFQISLRRLIYPY